MKYDNYEPDEECKMTARKILNNTLARTKLEKQSGMKGKMLYEALVHALVKGWIRIE